MAWNQNLNGIHYDIAAEIRSPVHVLAGPGTGKTFAMMRRIARFVEAGTNPQNILAVTFTRTAAKDLSQQLQLLGIEGVERVRATTLHSLCFSALAKEEVFSVTGRTARPLLSHEIKQLINDLAPDFGGKRNVNRLLVAYEAAWARLQHEEAGLPHTGQDREFQSRLLDWLRYHKAMLIGELVPLSLAFLRDNPLIQIFPAFEHVLVDEFQDLNRADQSLVLNLARNSTLTVIGDDNQSIYSFRHANPEGIRLFPEEYPDAVRYVIEECRRCPPNIVEISNSLISHDQRRLRAVPLQAIQGRDLAHISIIQHPSLNDEVNSIADYIDHYLRNNPDLPPGQVLVLATRRLLGHRIRHELIQRGRNALSYFAEDELDHISAAEGYCLLKLLVNPEDRAAFRAWIGLGNNQGNTPGYGRVRAYSQQNNTEPRTVLESLARGDIAIPYTSAILTRFRALQQRLEALNGLEGLALVRTLWQQNDIDSMDIRLLAESIALNTAEPEKILEKITAAITQPELPNSEDDIIRVMSLYKSKGLTASLVIVAGCVAGALPSIDSKLPEALQDAQLEEQRRLFYVAITRATQSLILSSSATLTVRDAMASGISVRARQFNGVENIALTSASSFFRELGPVAPQTINTDQWRRDQGF